MAKYLKQDSDLGYIENSAEIEYLKLNNLRHSILGFMLGDFDEQGYYTISTEIQKELLSMRKFIVNSVDNIDICHGVVMLDKPITFMVTFESDRATLSLVERISYEANMELNSGTYSNVNEFILDEVETAGEINRNLVYKRWNIGEFGGEVLSVNNMDATTLALYSGLVNRYKYLLAANKILLDKEEQLEDIEAEYTIGVIEILSRYPALKTLVDAEVKIEVQNKTKFLRLDKPNFAKTFNEILDQAIENNIGALNGTEINMFSQEKREVTQKRNMRMQAELNIKQQTTLEEESNQTELDEEFGKRTDKKIVMDAGNSTGRSIGELQAEFDGAEKSITDLIIEGAMSYFVAKNAKTIIEERLRMRGLNPAGQSRYGQNRRDAFVYITQIAGIKGQELLGDDQRKVLDEIEKQANKAHGVEPPKEKKVEAKKVAPLAKKPVAKKPEAKKPAAKKQEAKKPAAKKPEAKKAQPAPTPSKTNFGGGGGLISRQVNGNTNSTQNDINLGRATNAPSNPLKKEITFSIGGVKVTSATIDAEKSNVSSRRAAIPRTHTTNNNSNLGMGI